MAGDKPEGWYSRKARAQRSEAWRRRRQAAAERRAEEDRERQERTAHVERRLQPLRAYAASRLAAVPDDAAAHAAARKQVGRAQRELRKGRREMLDRWDHKNEGTPETHEKASYVRQDALAQLCEAGAIDAEQLGWALEIAQVAEQIERDVQVQTCSYETRVDCAGRARDPLIEGIRRVRAHRAYTLWRDSLPRPVRRAILDMVILPEPIPFGTAAHRYRISKPRAKKLLIDAIDRWPECVKAAAKEIDPASLAAYYAGLI